jgi:bifunctional ADP-heptose synthase (sugar kinase/adenylyltransferase)
VVNVENESTMLGGAGNVSNNLRALGAKVGVISVIGCCEASDELKNLLQKIQVDRQYFVTQEDRIISKKSRIIAAQQQVVRSYILVALDVVDYVVVFSEDTPYHLIKAIKPHILVKGGDYKGKQIVGQDLVNEVRLIDFIAGKSTSKIIKKIKES